MSAGSPRPASRGYYPDSPDFLKLPETNMMPRFAMAQSETAMGNETPTPVSPPDSMETGIQTKKPKMISPGTWATSSSERSRATAINPTTPPTSADTSH